MTNSSYLFGNDTINGWGLRYFFSFYSEFGGNQRQAGATLETIALLAILVASLLANTAIAAAIIRYREMRTITNCFLLNLALADIVFVSGAPFVAATRLTQQWTLGDGLCRLLPYSQFVCGAVLLWTLTLISIDRHRCIVVPPYRSRLTPRRAALLVIATWSLAAILFVPLTFWFRTQTVQAPSFDKPGYNLVPGDPVQICTLVFPKMDWITVSLLFTLPAILFACVLPMTLLVFHYQKIFRKLLDTRARWMVPATSTLHSATPSVTGGQQAPPSNLRRDSELSFSGIVGLNKTFRKLSINSRANAPRGSISLSQHEENRVHKHLRVVRVLLLNVILVLVMWLPITVVMILIYIDGRRPTESPLDDYFLRSCHFVWALIIALFNTVVNPLLYGVLSENFRVCFSKMWRGSNIVGGGCELANNNKGAEQPVAVSTPLGKVNRHHHSSAGSIATNNVVTNNLNIKNNNVTKNVSSASDWSNTSPQPPPPQLPTFNPSTQL